jgi:iron(III) transport system ATP-binding protein
VSAKTVESGVALTIDGLEVAYANAVAVSDITLSVKVGQHATLVGPSGCGKTTLLRAIAGLETPLRGRIALFGRTVFDAGLGIDVATERRQLSMMFQSYAIWPHMTVFDNVAYGLRLRRVAKAEITRRVSEALELVGMADYAERDAPRLSGGQQQRVALARSFVFGPKLLLFDEPLSNLDARLRARMRIELKELTARIGITSIYVTHDQEEAMALSDLVMVLDRGRVQQIADPRTAYFRPATAFVGEFMGASNLLPVRHIRPHAESGLAEAELDNGATIICHGSPAPGTPASVLVKTVHVALAAELPPASINQWRCRIVSSVFVGDFVEYVLDWNGLRLRSKDLSTRFFEDGWEIYCHIQPEHAALLARAAD